MGSKKKRKSVGKDDDHGSKKQVTNEQSTRHRSSPLTWKGDGVRATLASDQALLFVGRGSLIVLAGAILVNCKVCQVGDQPLELCADERVGGPLLLEPLVADFQVPQASAGTETAFSIVSSPAAGAGQPSFTVHLSNDPEAPRLLPFGLPWQQAVAEIVESVARGGSGMPAVIVVSGSKKVGKSTFARQLVNSLLNQQPMVAFMDTDCGQAEFTPPGLVSLSLLTRPVLGPPHMHMHMQPPALSYFVGDLSPASDPLAYLRYIREMYRWYCQHAALAAAAAAATAGGTAAACSSPGAAALPPLVVNTHGWVKGLGLDVLLELLQSLQQVTHFVQLCSANPHKNLPDGIFWAPAGTPPPAVLMWQLPALGGAAGDAQPALSGVSQSSARTTATATATATTAAGEEGSGRGGGGRMLAPVESRALQWAAFAQQCVDAMRCSGASGAQPPPPQQQQAGPTAGAPGTELADSLAALAPFEVGMDDVDVQVLHSSVPTSQLQFALNGSVVGLCTSQQHASEEPDPPAPCLGLGIVRAVDASRRLLYVLTTLGEEALGRVTMLQVGKLELPSSLLQSGNYLSPYLCLFSLTSMGTGAGVIRSRNNLLRQGQL